MGTMVSPRFVLLLPLCLASLAAPQPQVPAEERVLSFVHPGLLHAEDDLARVRQMLAEEREPWLSASRRLAEHPQSSDAWQLRGPFELVTRSPSGSRNDAQMVADARAAYQNALLWVLTREESHAYKAVEILNAWAHELKRVEGRDAQLAAGLNGFLMVNAAELMRHTWDQWLPGDIEQFETMLLEAIYPPLKDFATHANGNWDAACIKTMMAIGVFCDDRAIFDRAVNYYHHGPGNGRITNYVVNEAGQCQESGRDQQHTQLGLGCLAEACEVGFRQGIDMYGAADNRLLRGLEYTAKYNLGENVPFEEHTDTTGKYHHERISRHGRGRLRPIYEMTLNHYQNRMGFETPYLRLAAQQTRPDGAGRHADHPGFGTLMFYQIGRAATPMNSSSDTKAVSSQCANGL